MPHFTGDWSTEQLTELLASITDLTDEKQAISTTIERAAEALEAEVGAVVFDGYIAASIGFPAKAIPERELIDISERLRHHIDVPSIGRCDAVVVPLADVVGGTMMLARGGNVPFSREETNLLRGMARVLVLSLRQLRLLDRERTLRERSERQAEENQLLLDQLEERRRLLEKLTKIQRSISHRAPLQEVLDSITAGAAELLGDEIAGLRQIDPDDPNYFVLSSVNGVSDHIRNIIKRGPIGEGAGGRAILENRLVIIDNYQEDTLAIPALAEARVHTAMAAPVHEHGQVVGSLVVASFRPGRSYTESEQAALLALAEHTSLALNDAKTVEGMREAQRAKDLFFAMASHELKTPLTVIMGTLKTFERHHDALPDDLRREMLASAFERGSELRSLIDRLLQGSRAELAGYVQEADLAEVIHGAVRGFEQQRSVHFGHLPGMVCHLDRVAVHEVLGILLENAVSHSPEASEINVSATATSESVAITVRNSGALPPDLDHATLFLPFQRGAEDASTGVGLGLYIAARLAHSIGGRIDVASDRATVSFTFHFPIAAPVAEAANIGTAVDG
ncbi:MAG: GAF domain-containing protein [Actinomycetota bacterium]|nr:GAF domain-containing protein [Actinomycetota bacterium]